MERRHNQNDSDRYYALKRMSKNDLIRRVMEQPTVTAVSADKSLIRIENYGDYVSREKVERWSEFAGDYAVDIVGRLMRLDGQLDFCRDLIRQGAVTLSALKPFPGEYVAVRVKLHGILDRFGLSPHIPEYAAIIQTTTNREQAILEALKGNLDHLMQSNLDDSPIYQNMMIGAEHIERAGRKRSKVWDWIIKAGEALKPDLKRYTYKRDIIPTLLDAVEKLDQSDQVTIDIKHTLLDGLEDVEDFRNRYNKAKNNPNRKPGK